MLSLVITLSVSCYHALVLFVDSILQRPEGYQFIRKFFWYCVLKLREPSELLARPAEYNSDNNNNNNQQQNDINNRQPSLIERENLQSDININNQEVNRQNLELNGLEINNDQRQLLNDSNEYYQSNDSNNSNDSGINAINRNITSR